jgi:curved DNA-binding protein
VNPNVSKDYYAVLGVAPTSTPQDIKKAFRRMARECHPDVFPNDKQKEAQFKEISEAYEVIGDPDARRRYDEARRLSTPVYSSNHPPKRPPPSRPGTTSAPPPSSARSPDFDFSEFGSFEELLDAFFPSQTDVEIGEPPSVLVLLAAEAFNGCVRKFMIEHRIQQRRFPAGLVTGRALTLGKELSTKIQVDFKGTLYRFEGENLLCLLPLSEDEARAGGVIHSHPTPWGPVELAVPKGLTNGKRLKLSRKGWPKATPWQSLSSSQRAALSDSTDHPLSAHELQRLGLVSDLLLEITVVSDAAPRRDWNKYKWILATHSSP